MKHTKSLIAFLFLTLMQVNCLFAQTPSTCFEIESILVDACGTPEEENEMVRFVVGPAQLNTNNLTVSWPNINNPFRGICQNANTASKVAALNATIQGCGFLKEPVAGILPAGAKVLFITDVLVSTTANSFTNLNDTLYVIFQCSGNSSGHFVNYDSNPGVRTLTISFSSPASCSDQVSYDRSLLINQNGTSGGSASILNGGRVDYTWNGIATYANDGCQGLFTPLTANAGSNQNVCTGNTAQINGIVSGNYNSITWSGGNGTFSDPGNDTTVYTPGPGETGNVVLTMTVQSPCNDVITSSVTVTINSIPSASISLSSNDTICAGSSVTLTASGGSTYSWSTGSTLPSIQVTASGVYSVTASNNCGSSTASQTIQVNPQPATAITASGPLSFCSGGSVTLTAGGADSFLWSDGTTGSSITVSQSGTYSVTGTTSCGSSTVSETVTVESAPVVSIAASGPLSFCEGSSVTLSASGAGAGTYSWSEGSSTSAITVSSGGSFTVTGTNNCGSSTAAITTTEIAEPIAVITGDLAICNGEQTSLTVSGGDTYLWSTGSSAQTEVITNAASVYAIAINACGDDTAFVNISSSTIISAFSADTTSGIAPLLVNFTNGSTNANTYSWSFGDNSSSIESSPSYSFTTAGTYQVILTASNSDGCSDTSSMTVVVLEPVSMLIIPNVFTPNSDTKNDFFTFEHQGLSEFNCVIFNRWGNKIVELTDLTPGWDGKTTNGDPAPSGTYYYVIKATGLDNVRYDLNESFMLFR